MNIVKFITRIAFLSLLLLKDSISAETVDIPTVQEVVDQSTTPIIEPAPDKSLINRVKEYAPHVSLAVTGVGVGLITSGGDISENKKLGSLIVVGSAAITVASSNTNPYLRYTLGALLAGSAAYFWYNDNSK